MHTYFHFQSLFPFFKIENFFYHLVIIIIHIIHIIFLFHTAITNLIAYFPIKPMGICFLHYWPGCPCFKSFRFIAGLQVTATIFIILAHLGYRKAIKCTPNSL